MNNWAFYPVFIGTIISMVGWVHFVKQKYDKSPKTLSELAATDAENIRYFRTILWICGPLFGLTALFFMASRINNAVLVYLWAAIVILEILVGVFPPINKPKKLLHEIIAYSMAFLMFCAGILVAVRLDRIAALLEWLLVGCMIFFAIGGYFHRTRYIYYELGFIFSSHLTLVVAAIALLDK